MKAIASCINNLEHITQLEIKEILKLDSKIVCLSRVELDITSEKDLANFIYKARSITKAYLLLKNLKFKSIDEIINAVKDIEFPYMKDTFVVRCERKGSHEFSSMDVDREIGKELYKKL